MDMGINKPQITDIRTEYIKAGDITFEIDICGTGDKFALCLHGFPEHNHSWRKQLPLLAKNGYTVWAPNMRGYGNSTRPTKVSDYDISLLLSDVANIIDVAKAKDTLLIAHDWGGYIAWIFAHSKERPLSGLILLNCPHPHIFMQQAKKWSQFKKSWYIYMFQIPVLPEFLLGLNHAKAVGRLFYNMAIDKSNFTQELQDFYSEQASKPGALKAMINYYRANFKISGMLKDYRDIIVTLIETPTLLIWGEADAALSKELTYGLDKLVNDITIHYLKNVSHCVQLEAPDKVNTHIEAWLKENK